MAILSASRVLSAPDESFLLSVISPALKCLQELRVGFLSVFFFLPSFSFSLLLLLFSLGFALGTLSVLAELMLVDLLLLWFSVSVGKECTSE